MKHRIYMTLIVFCILLSFPANVFAEKKDKQAPIIVQDENDILEFLNSEGSDTILTYIFIYSQEEATRIVCSHCGYNTLRGATYEIPNPYNPGGQGRTHGCPYFNLSPDTVNEYAVYYYQHCTTCGYSSNPTLSEIKYYIYCSTADTYWVATDWKTTHHIGDVHEWKTTWD